MIFRAFDAPPKMIVFLLIVQVSMQLHDRLRQARPQAEIPSPPDALTSFGPSEQSFVGVPVVAANGVLVSQGWIEARAVPHVHRCKERPVHGIDSWKADNKSTSIPAIRISLRATALLPKPLLSSDSLMLQPDIQIRYMLCDNGRAYTDAL